MRFLRSSSAPSSSGTWSPATSAGPRPAPPLATAPKPTGRLERVRRTVALLERRGYALPAARLAELCLGGEISALEVRFAVAASGGELCEAQGLVVSSDLQGRASAIRRRTDDHAAAALYGERQRCALGVAQHDGRVTVEVARAPSGICQAQHLKDSPRRGRGGGVGRND